MAALVKIQNSYFKIKEFIKITEYNDVLIIFYDIYNTITIPKMEIIDLLNILDYVNENYSVITDKMLGEIICDFLKIS